MKPFRNETHFDPGRFRSVVTFYKQTDTVNEYGGTVQTYEEVKKVRAIDLQIKNNDQLAINAGASVINDDRYFILRKGFKPEYDMVASSNGNRYVVTAVIPIDMPVRFWRVLCTRKDDQETWPE